LLQLYAWLGSLMGLGRSRLEAIAGGQPWLTRLRRREEGQTTAEYALVLLAAAAVAFVLIAWAQSSNKLPDFFNMIIDTITGDVQ
jgi:Flp pilus assembly pilin Flp